jgi:hypothetical protein
MTVKSFLNTVYDDGEPEELATMLHTGKTRPARILNQLMFLANKNYRVYINYKGYEYSIRFSVES